VEDVGVDEGERGLGADVGGEARHAGVVEADDEVVRVDLRVAAGAEEGAAVADDGAGAEAPAEEAGEFGHDARDGAAAEMAREDEAAERRTEGREEGLVAGGPVEGDTEAGDDSRLRRAGLRRVVEREAEVEEPVLVAEDGEGGYRGVGEERCRLG
jgi:hypothetical protein